MRGGYTLVEILVAMALALVLGTLLVRLLFTTFNVTSDKRARADLQTAATIALSRLVDDLRASPVAGMSFAGESEFSLHGLAEVSSEGAQVWSDRLVYYHHHNTETTLKRWELALHDVEADATTSGPLILQAPDISGLAALQPLQRNDYPGVTDFSMRTQGELGSATPFVEVEMVVEKETLRPVRRQLRMEVRRTVFLPNSAH